MIEFPKLGIKFLLNHIAVNFFGINIYWYGIIIALGFVIAVFWTLKEAHKFEIAQETIIDMLLVVVPASIIGARLYYVIFNFNLFRGDLLQMLNIRTGGLAIYGAIIFAVGGLLIFCKYRSLKPLKILDFSCVYLIFGQAVGRWGNFVNQEAFGTNTYLPWGMTGDKIQFELARLNAMGINVNPNVPVHPTFLYESLWDLIVLLSLIWFRKRKKIDGEVFMLYLILYSIGRIFIEGLRLDSLMIGNFRVSQVLAIILVIVFSIIFLIRRRNVSHYSEVRQ